MSNKKWIFNLCRQGFVCFGYPCECGSNSRKDILLKQTLCLGVEIINENMECLHPFKKNENHIRSMLFQETLYLEYSCKTCEQAFILIKLIITFVIKLKTHPLIVMNLFGGDSPNNINFIFTIISGSLILKCPFLEFTYYLLAKIP